MIQSDTPERPINAGSKPLVQASVAADLTIETVISMADGKAYEARALLEQPDFLVVRLRNRLVEATSACLEGSATDDATYRCATCGEPVRIMNTKHHREVYYFQHAQRGVNCPLTLQRLSQDEINARRFRGQPEGERHKTIKRLIYASLMADPAFCEAQVERTWTSEVEPTRRKRPDVQAVRRGVRHAFEAQLSSTSAMTIAERNRFYREEGAAITWITDVVPDSDWRMYLKDLADVHRGNVFVVDEATAVASMKAGRFLVRCHYTRPVWTNGEIAQQSVAELLGVDDLKIQDGRTYYFDSVAAFEDALRTKSAAAARKTRAPSLKVPDAAETEASERQLWKAADELIQKLPAEHLRTQVLRLLAEEPRRSGWQSATVQRYYKVARAAVAAAGAVLPDMRSWEFAPAERRLAALFSIELGKVMGYRFPTLVQVAHQVQCGQRPAMTALLHVARHFGTETILMAEDRHGHWARKVSDLKHVALNRQEAPASWAPYEPEGWWRELVRVIYPEVGAFHRRENEGGSPGALSPP